MIENLSLVNGLGLVAMVIAACAPLVTVAVVFAVMREQGKRNKDDIERLRLEFAERMAGINERISANQRDTAIFMKGIADEIKSVEINMARVTTRLDIQGVTK